MISPPYAGGKSQIYITPIPAAGGSALPVSRNASRQPANDDSFRPRISADGRYVVYESIASDLVPGNTNQASDAFLWDRLTNSTIRLSVDSEGSQSSPLTFGSVWPVISADGRFVAFASDATNLVANDRNGVRDIFVRGPLR